MASENQYTKVSFFLRSESGHGFPPKKQASDWMTYLVYHLAVCFFGGKPLELMSLLRSQKKLTLVITHNAVF